MKRLFAYHPSLSQSWILLLLVLVTQIPGSIVAGAISSITDSEGEAWSTLLAYLLSFVLMAFIVIRFGKDQARAGGEATPVKGITPTPLLYVLLLIFTPLLSVVIEPLSVWLPMPECMKQLFEKMFGNKSVALFLTAVVAAPLCEEWLCRGVILKGLLKHTTPAKAIIHSSIIFAVMHLNPWQAIPAFCIALAIGWVYYRTRSLWPCIFMHAVNNGLSFLMLFIFPDAGMDTSLYDIAGSHYLPLYARALVLAAGLGYVLWRKWK